MYWCRIPDNSWSRTVLHDKAHWRVLTIYRTSDLSWVHFTKRWKIIWPKRLDSREHQNWARVRSHNSYLQGKYGVESRIESINKDNSHSWVRISYGLNKLVTDLIENKEYDDNEQETSETKSDEFALKTNVLAFASRSKAKAKPRRSASACSSTRTLHICDRFWTDVEPGTYSNIAFPVWKRMTTLLRHGPLLREEDGAIEFWRLKDYLRNEFGNSQHWSDEMWKSKMTGGGGTKKRFQYCTDSSGHEILYLRALQGHSGRNPIDPSLQDNVLIPDNFFEYIYHIGCAINLHSITNSGLIPVGQKFRQGKTDSILYGCESHGQRTQGSVQAWLDSTTSCMVQAENVEKTPRHGVLGWYTACSTERIEFLSNKIERNHPLRHTPS